MTSEFLERAAQHLAQARAIDGEFRGKTMPAEASRQMKAHLDKVREYRERDEAQVSLKAQEAWMSEPQYRHDMVGSGDDVTFDSIILGKQYGGAPGAYDHMSAPVPISGKMGVWARDYARGKKSALVEDATSGGDDLVPADFAGIIVKDYSRLAVIEPLAQVIPTNSRQVDVGNVKIASGGWGVLELAGSTTTDGLPANPIADKDSIEVHDLTALVKLGVNELDDAPMVEAIIREALAQKFAEQLDDAFAFGDGNDKPTGIAYGSTITQKVTSAVADTLAFDDVIKLKYAVPAWAERNGVYLAHGSALQAAMLLKDSNGAYLWQESPRVGEPSTLAGRAVYRVDGLPAVTASTGAVNTSMVFGDVRSGYLITRRSALTVQLLRERYVEEGKVGLLFKQRVGAGVIRPKALAALAI